MSSSLKILVVDDTPANLEVICETLGDAGYEVITAIDGDRALRRIQTNLPDLILLDVQMPGIDGFETCQRLKADPTTANIPVIFMTALSDTDSKVKGFDLGAVDYVTKPFQEQEMLARVKTQLQLWQLTKNLEQHINERTAELKTALDQLHHSQLQLVQSEKMSALGNLVAGVAHEINNPVGFIAGNLQPAQDYVQNLLQLVALYQQELPHPSATLQAAIEEMDLEYLQEDLPKLLISMREGVNRIRNISTSLRTFSRADCDRPIPFNIHEGLDSTLMILQHRLKANEFRPAIEVIKHYGEIPQIECYVGQLNQVFMNILANAIDALEEVTQKRSFENIKTNPNQITIRTQLTDDPQLVQLRIQDNGIGMSQEVKQRIFDHLFTTKEIGKGTGLGLAIAYQIVTEKHNGSLDVNSTLGQGTEFIVTLPVKIQVIY
ncbi:hybrid sensor histidine kinase/response regulator [Komarekiella sp. 'clone 1']|uniref:histidine kinase n=1 Tax=Komarekiella delphini-convector SJRDD-AB1 TaxID=2593771 RepID=A0AA40SY52_9NOST|nr:response regulator [Komarekiella delphini-convector]MBD6617463.1 hybrid sensor histidine kinase/response regulator [Komarekiella delphini-convector SJRDD-AB1]